MKSIYLLLFVSFMSIIACRQRNHQSHVKTGSPEENLEPSAISRLKEIKIPTLIITAENDLESCKEIANIMEKEISGSKKVIMKGAGHIMNMDNAEEFNKYMVDFIDNLKIKEQ